MANLVEKSTNFIRHPMTPVFAGVVTIYLGMGDLDNIQSEIKTKASEANPPVVSELELSKAKAIISSFNSKLSSTTEEIVLSGGTTIEIPSLVEIERLRKSYEVKKKEEVRQSAISSMKTDLFSNRPLERTARPIGIIITGLGLLLLGGTRVMRTPLYPTARKSAKPSEQAS